MLPAFGFAGLPAALVAFNNRTIAEMRVAGEGWLMEGVDKTRVYDGAGDRVLSEKRRSYGEYQRSTLASEVAAHSSHALTLTDPHPPTLVLCHVPHRHTSPPPLSLPLFWILSFILW